VHIFQSDFISGFSLKRMPSKVWYYIISKWQSIKRKLFQEKTNFNDDYSRWLLECM